jgi:hypothetical protein
MSASSPGNGASPIADPPPGSGASASATVAPVQATTAPSDYLARIASDSSFAQEEVRKHQSRADQVEAQYKAQQDWVNPLSRYRESGLSGEDIAGHLDNMAKLVNNQDMQKFIGEFLRTGEIPRVHRKIGQPVVDDPADEDSDLYLTDEQREIRGLKEEMEGLKSQLVQQTSHVGQQALKSHLEKIAGEMGITGERFEKVRKSLIDQVGTWQTQGDAGRQALATLQTPQGEETVRALVMKSIPWNEVMEMAGEQRLRLAKLRGELTTDGPSEHVAPGTEEPPQFKNALEALRAAQAHPEKLSEWGY